MRFSLRRIMTHTTAVMFKGLLLLACLWASQTLAQNANSTFRFDHFQTGFALEGVHKTLDCESCHTRGVFKGTPTQCVNCHMDGGAVKASAKHTNHLQTVDTCEDCHTPQEWTFVARVDHLSVLGTCGSCHNESGIYASGLSPNHIPLTDNNCDDCHLTQEWNTVNFDHANVDITTCYRCHDGVTATGKNATHINSSNSCESCHFSTLVWSPVQRVDHEEVRGTCFSCHDGVVAGGKNPTHIAASNVCETCHTNTISWAPVSLVDHDQVIGECFDCHNAVIATGKHDGHIAASNNCEACHTTTAFSPPFTIDPNELR